MTTETILPTEAEASTPPANDRPAEEHVSRNRPGDARSRKSNPVQGMAFMAAGVLWIALLVLGAFSLGPVAQATAREFDRYLLIHASEDAIRERLGAGPRKGATADDLEIMSELALLVSHQEGALGLSRQTVAEDDARPYVWARIAWLESEKAGGITPATLEALQKSMDFCPLCDQELIRWRFNFVLANWKAMPEELRRDAFEHADILRWRGLNAEFLAEMKVKSYRAGIPFDAYRAAVNTPVRTWDLGPQFNKTGRDKNS